MLEKIIKEMSEDTDLYPWYWISVGEKCYAFVTVSAYPLELGDEYPTPGTQLKMNEEGELVGENGVLMIVENEIAYIEKNDGGTICKFIAMVHAELLKDHIELLNE